MYLKQFQRKGQATIEFLLIFVVLLSIFLFALYASFSRSAIVMNKEDVITAKNLASTFGNIINNVSLSNEGLQKKYFLNTDKSYTFYVSNYKLYVVIPDSNSTFDFPLITDDVNFSVTNHSWISFKKVNNRVVVEDAE